MPDREQKKKPAPQRTDETELEDLDVDTTSGDELLSEMDDLLDEIDDVLETNAEEFVKSYVQKGGE